ncbi:MAG: trypsin-like peptidase domain-containing protein [Bacillota bacterium]
MRKRLLVLLLVAVLLVSGSSLAVAAKYAGYPTVNVTVDGQAVASDVPAISVNGTTMVPLRTIAEAMGATVSYVAETQSVNIQTDFRSRLDEMEKKVDGLQTEIDLVANSGFSPSDVYEKVRPTVVSLIVKTKEPNGQTGYGSGTGVVTWKSDDGKEAEISTNRHVVQKAEDILVILNDGRVLSGKFWADDADLDLAAVRIYGSDLPPVIQWGDPDQHPIGSLVLAIGNPLGYKDSVSMGVLSGKNRAQDNSGYEYLQTDAAVNPGNSGGPLVDGDGLFLGLVTQKVVSESVEGLAFAISVKSIKQSIEVSHHPDQKRLYLGAILQETVAASYGAQSDTGPFIVRLDSNGCLAKAGLVAGDEITAINGQNIFYLSDVRNIVDTVLPGTPMSLKYRRGSLEIETQIVPDGISRWELKPILQYSPPLYAWEGAF